MKLQNSLINPAVDKKDFYQQDDYYRYVNIDIQEKQKLILQFISSLIRKKLDKEYKKSSKINLMNKIKKIRKQIIFKSDIQKKLLSPI